MPLNICSCAVSFLHTGQYLISLFLFLSFLFFSAAIAPVAANFIHLTGVSKVSHNFFWVWVWGLNFNPTNQPTGNPTSLLTPLQPYNYPITTLRLFAPLYWPHYLYTYIYIHTPMNTHSCVCASVKMVHTHCVWVYNVTPFCTPLSLCNPLTYCTTQGDCKFRRK